MSPSSKTPTGPPKCEYVNPNTKGTCSEAKAADSDFCSAHTCIIRGCKRQVLANGMCRQHYDRQRKGRDLSEPIREYGTGGKVTMPTPKLPKDIAAWYEGEAKRTGQSRYEIVNEVLTNHARSRSAGK